MGFKRLLVPPMDHEQFIEGVIPDPLYVNPIVHKEVFDRYLRVKINLLLWPLQPHRSPFGPCPPQCPGIRDAPCDGQRTQF